MSQGDELSQHVARNIQAYSKRAASYDRIHGEIFNPQEQSRLGDAVAKASEAVRSDGRMALDFGAGSGNVTRHMLSLQYDVTAADVSPDFLRTIEARFDVQTIELVAGSLSYVPDDAFDLIGVYSVMHHIPDYLAAAAGLVKKLKPGGVLLIDHERNNNHWTPSHELAEFRRENASARTGEFWDPQHKRWQYLLRAGVVPSRHVARFNKRRRISDEGDIHIYPDDHINWGDLIRALQEAGAELVERMDYLLFETGYNEVVWERHRHRCNDVSGAIVRRAR
jgi:ubiquinone/menaquinone biosynthesis C-methylase UbiE